MQALRATDTRSLLALKLIVAALALLQCLLPLLHAHPQAGGFRGDDPALGSIHLPSQVHAWAGTDEGAPLPEAVTPVDDSGRVKPGLQAVGASGAGLALPVARASHERPRDGSSPGASGPRHRFAGSPRAPPHLS